MGRDRKEAVLVAALILCVLVQTALTVWMLSGGRLDATP